MDTIIDTTMDAKEPPKQEGRGAFGRFVRGHKIGHRFPKGHPQYPIRRNAHERLKRKLIRALIEEYGPDLTAKQMEHIRNAADIRARLQLQDENVDPIVIATLINSQRRELEALNE